MITQVRKRATAHPLRPVQETAIRAAQEAGALLRAELQRPDGPRGHGGHAVLDRQVDELLHERLMDVLPCSWIGKETGRVVVPGPHVWVVDPHDGTAAFLERRCGPVGAV